MHAFIKATALAAASASIATAVPASAAVQSYGPASATQFHAPGEETSAYGRDRYRYSREDRRRGYGRDRYRGYDRPTRVWRGNNGRYYCRKQDGTTGLLIGGAAGALLGREIDGGRDRTVGTLLGAVGGALLGREIDRSDSRCR
ncbi:glycine zipper 2TM domain-containing protein [Novosphingobium profundi]|uniref:glycine zipper 2TM domain-containing protein n=1 Tax=Novosphingobium profundi TaxID=1774954 RepID=UPI001BDB2D76|nr:glycine zipper 2TM domain-containing protein [Novosphingobium profundi]MBT0669924.1 glycine zipper 2TM domain-containing protein [Novosphingobium profundi]